ncbi:MAG: hypothetical protein HQ572_01590 [Candidatus Omnitrophica bacterium]|nr:hypothetical protein [Candidatus Omnitrophota bacterium]
MSLKKFFNSEIHKKVIIFFRDNPSSIDTPRGVATWVGTSREKAKKVLDELQKEGILNAIETSSTSGYSFTQDKKIIKKIDEFTKK